jgi:drug/metabolite transporter (DMT)-like permease
MTQASRPLTGIGCLLVAMVLLPIMDGSAKHLSATLPVLMSVWARFFFQTVIVAPIVVRRHGAAALLPDRFVLQLLRGLCLVGANASFFGSLVYLPLADSLSIFFISPILVTAVSPVFLGERVGLRRWLAVLAGFAGVLIIIRPGFGSLNAGTLLALASGLLFATFVIMTRRLRDLPVLVTTLYNALFGAVALTLAAPVFWVWPSAAEWPYLIAIGVISIAGHYMLIMSYERAEASLLAPFAYTEIITATLIGYLWFGDLPDRWTVTGVAILAASGIYISWHEAIKRRPSAAAAPPAEM